MEAKTVFISSLPTVAMYIVQFIKFCQEMSNTRLVMMVGRFQIRDRLDAGDS